MLPIAACCAVIIFSACSKDETPEPTPAPKRATRLTMTRQGEATPYLTYNIRYNPDGTFAELGLHSEEDGETFTTIFSRQDNQLILTLGSGGREMKYWLDESGNIVTTVSEMPLASSSPRPRYRLPMFVFDYADGFLKTVTIEGLPYMNCTWVRGNLVLVTGLYGETTAAPVFYTYSGTANKMTIDPSHLFYDFSNGGDPGSPPSLLFSSGYAGRISKHLPAGIRMIGGNGETVVSFTYEFDDEGYPVVISAFKKWNDPDDGSELKEEIDIRITYAVQ